MGWLLLRDRQQWELCEWGRPRGEAPAGVGSSPGSLAPFSPLSQGPRPQQTGLVPHPGVCQAPGAECPWLRAQGLEADYLAQSPFSHLIGPWPGEYV